MWHHVRKQLSNHNRYWCNIVNGLSIALQNFSFLNLFKKTMRPCFSTANFPLHLSFLYTQRWGIWRPTEISQTSDSGLYDETNPGSVSRHKKDPTSPSIYIHVPYSWGKYLYIQTCTLQLRYAPLYTDMYPTAEVSPFIYRHVPNSRGKYLFIQICFP